MDSVLSGIAKAAWHLVFSDVGSAFGERSAMLAAGASWANGETLNFLYDDFTGTSTRNVTRHGAPRLPRELTCCDMEYKLLRITFISSIIVFHKE